MTRKQCIMDAAARLFAEKGYYNTSTIEIAESAGVAHGTLFYHYKNKEGIIYEILRQSGQFYISRLREAVRGEKTGMEKIEAMLRFNSSFIRTHSNLLLVFLRDLPEKMTSEDSPLKEISSSTNYQVLEIIEKCLSEGISDGSINTPDTSRTAFIINGLVLGIIYMRLLSPIDVPELEENVHEFCRAALAPEKS